VAFCQNSLITCDKEPKYIVCVCEMSAVCVGAPDPPGKKKIFFWGGECDASFCQNSLTACYKEPKYLVCVCAVSADYGCGCWRVRVTGVSVVRGPCVPRRIGG